MKRAVARAAKQTAVETCKRRIAVACPVLADASVGAVVGTGPQGAVDSCKAGLAVTSSVVTKPISCAVIRAGLNGTIVSSKATITHARPIHALAMLRAVPWTRPD